MISSSEFSNVCGSEVLSLALFYPVHLTVSNM